AVPRLHGGAARPFVVAAAGLYRRHVTLETELLDRSRIDRQVLQPPPHFLAFQRLVAELALRLLHRFHGHHRRDETAVVKHLTDLFFLAGGALVLVMEVLDDVLVHRALSGSGEEHERVVAFGAVARRDDIRLGPGPPHAVHLVARIAGRHGLLDGGGVHHAPAPQEDIVGALLAN